MLTYFLLMTAVVFFVWGLILIIQGWYGSADEIVPLTDLEEIKDLGVKMPAPILKPAPAISAPPSAPQNPQNHVLLEEYKKKLHLLEEEKNALEAKIVRQAGEEQQKIIQLNQENSRLEKDLKEREAKLQQLEQDLKTAQDQGDKLQKEEQIQIKTMEERLRDLLEEKEQLILSKEMVDALRSEKERLQIGGQESRLEIERLEKELLQMRQGIQSRQAQWEEAVTRLKEENQALLQLRQQREEELGKLNAQLELIQKTNNQRLNEANRTVELLKIQKEESDRARQEVLNQELAQMTAAAESLTKDKEALERVKDELEENLRKVKELNNHLLDREKILQQELMKSRAQALGLEKICEDFKAQIEEMDRAAVAKT